MTRMVAQLSGRRQDVPPPRQVSHTAERTASGRACCLVKWLELDNLFQMFSSIPIKKPRLLEIVDGKEMNRLSHWLPEADRKTDTGCRIITAGGTDPAGGFSAELRQERADTRRGSNHK